MARNPGGFTNEGKEMHVYIITGKKLKALLFKIEKVKELVKEEKSGSKGQTTNWQSKLYQQESTHITT